MMTTITKPNTKSFIDVCKLISNQKDTVVEEPGEGCKSYTLKMKGVTVVVLEDPKGYTLQTFDSHGNDAFRVNRRYPRNDRDLNASLFRNEKIALDSIVKKVLEHAGLSHN